MTDIEILLTVLNQSFDKRSWHGTNLRGSIRGLTVEQVAWRPNQLRHSIWEHILHAAYWKYTVWRRLTGEKRGSFPLKGSNWFSRPEGSHADEKSWRKDVDLLVSMHASLKEAVSRLSSKQIAESPSDGSTSILSLVTGIAAHDVYHAGQIQLLKRLQLDSKE